MKTTGIRFVDDVNLKNKRVFIRCDFNVPLDTQGKITDDTRIRAALPTIIQAIDQEAATIVLASHLGRPKGEPDPSLSMVPVGQRLYELLGYEVIVPDDIMDDHVGSLIDTIDPSRQIMLLENLRFYPGEKKNDEAFASRLASFAQVYIDDAFGTAHRAHASVYGMVRHFDEKTHMKLGGLLMKREITELGALLNRPKRPFVAVMGGAKVSDKLGVLHTLIERCDAILIGGAMAYTFLKAQGATVGDSMVEQDRLEEASDILAQASRRGVTLHLPQDHVVVSKFESDDATTTPGREIPAGKMALDIGPATRRAFADVIRDAGTVFWNGPMGVFERDAFAAGTFAVARAVALSRATSVVGGGDSVSAITKAGVLDQITHVSTGGGASLEFIEGKPLPGIEALRSNHPFNLS